MACHPLLPVSWAIIRHVCRQALGSCLGICRQTGESGNHCVNVWKSNVCVQYSASVPVLGIGVNGSCPKKCKNKKVGVVEGEGEKVWELWGKVQGELG